ncbi:hypothetical protein M419DRAFT_32154 [Trichoderma reesei RUT C-30]|uniref:Uncharacterized protein n=1 Tax=Hypocrea jecorina (strain ATCC 56765 / BCRC 32924 / NRRL 11460 / Rut C-30) TaxID=1344414 RepID=A0A024SN31_HYPJR|nr:hypothetical protein M419DRAFT_32154 [Trichoderma reesei RUT C-30]
MQGTDWVGFPPAVRATVARTVSHAAANGCGRHRIATEAERASRWSSRWSSPVAAAHRPRWPGTNVSAWELVERVVGGCGQTEQSVNEHFIRDEQQPRCIETAKGGVALYYQQIRTANTSPRP